MRILLLLILIAFHSVAQDTLKTCRAVRTQESPKIDGILNDEVWKSAIPVNDFVMNRPKEGGIATQKSEVRVIYDDRAIYVAAMLYDINPDSILHELGSRDDGDLNADFFRFVIDPYNLRQDAFDFGVWASGVQVDSKFSDPTFNAVWSSAVTINEKGWCVEMAIPYSAIRFPKKAVQEWAMQSTRSIRRTREFDQWALTPSSAANALVYWGTLKGIENIQTPIRLSVTPYVSIYEERSPDYLSDNSYHYSNSFSYNFGADLKYGIDDRFTLDMTLFPDFGQVQSDNKVKNLSYQEVVYNENRSFFKEGTDLFSKNGLFYTRRIGKTPTLYYSIADSLKPGEELDVNPTQVNLLNAFKISGRNNNGLGIGLFNAITENTYAEIIEADGNKRKVLTEPLTNYNIVVFDQQLNNYSNVWFINTNVIRDKKYDNSNVSLAGWTIADKKNNFATDGLYALSQTFVKNDTSGTLATTWGNRLFLGARKISGNVQYGISHSQTSNTYNQLDLGYYLVPNISNTREYFTYLWFQPWKGFRDGNINLTCDYGVNPITDRRLQFQLALDAFSTLMSYHAIFFGGGVAPNSGLDYNEPRVEGRYDITIPYWWSYAGFSSDYRKAFAVDFNFNLSNFIDRFVSEGYNFSTILRYRFSDKFTLRFLNRYSFDPYNYGVADYSDPQNIIFGTRRLNTYENTLSGKYIFKNDMSLTLNVRHYWSTGEYRQYLTLLEDGNTVPDDNYNYNNNFNYNVFNVDLVYSWQFAPGSNLSVVYKNAIENSTDVITVNYSEDLKNTLHYPQLNSVSVKVIYYLDYLYLKKRSS